MAFLIILVLGGIIAAVVAQYQGTEKKQKDRKALPERLSVRYFDDTILLSETEAWTYLRLPTVSVEFKTPEEWDRLISSFAHAFAGLNDVRVHLKTAFRGYNIADWAEQLDKRTRNPAPGWGDLLVAQQEHLWHEHFLQKEVYLGVRLGHRSTEATTALKGAWQTIERFFNRAADAVVGEDDAIKDKEIARWRAAAVPIQRLIRGSAFGGVPATSDEIAWLFRHHMHPEMPTPPAPAMENQPWGRGEVQHLIEGHIDQSSSPYYLKITQPNWDYVKLDDAFLMDPDNVEPPERFYESYVATLCISRMPLEMETWDGNPWIHHAEDPELGFAVEFSGHFDIAPPSKAKKEVEKQVQKVSAQQRHIEEAGAEVPTGVADAFYAGKDLEAEVERSRRFLIFGAGRFLISAPDPDELTRRCQVIIEHYRDIGIDVVWTPNDQLRLFTEQFPGDKPRLNVRAYRQVQEMEAVSAGLFTASNSLGDGEGPYLGRTTGRSEEIVHFDPLYAPRNNKPPGVAIVGAPGGGKTFTTLTTAYQTAMRGITTVLLDPKGDAKGLATIEGLGDVRILELGAKLAGLLDPFSLADSREEGTLLAMETMRLLLGGEMTAERETVIVSAIRFVAVQPDPNLRKVVDVLLAGGVEALTGVQTQFSEQQKTVARSAGNLLQVISELPLGNLCFSHASSSVKIAQGRLTIITLAGLSLPSASTDQDRYTYAQRLSVTLLYLVTHYARTLVSDPLYTGPKALIIDEAWAITQTAQGAQLVAEVARLGRSRNTAMVLVSQNAKDLLAEDVKNCLTTMFVFRSEDPDEILADLELLRVSDSEEHRNIIATLPTGKNSECIMRDIKGHVGTMRVDMSYLPDVIVAFDSTPDDGEGRVQSAARRIITDESGKVLGVANSAEEAVALQAEIDARQLTAAQLPSVPALPSVPPAHSGPPAVPSAPPTQRSSTTYGGSATPPNWNNNQ
ncbi:MAG: ATPase [Corynebacteriales bacterium]|nr:ATPase [Mycobacteriales bacterium]